MKSNRSPRRPTQADMYYAAERKTADGNALFMKLVRDGLTQQELQKLIDKRPSLWGRFAGFLPKLPVRA